MRQFCWFGSVVRNLTNLVFAYYSIHQHLEFPKIEPVKCGPVYAALNVPSTP